MDIESLLKLFNAHRVRYVIIGATAFPVFGYVRATMDLDMFIEPTEENAQKAHAALCEFGYDLDHLIQMKKAAGRIKDKQDLKVLRKIKKSTTNSSPDEK